MPIIRLVNARLGAVETFEIGSEPSYVAISHTWAEGLFPMYILFLQSPGGKILHQALKGRDWPVDYCWIDTLCIDQDCEQDKIQQIPLMGQIYTTAAAGVAMMSQSFGLVQEDINKLTQALKPARKMSEDETWNVDGDSWRHGNGREIIVKTMNALTALVRSDWVTRVWTLQEYVLSRKFFWLDLDGIDLDIEDWLFVTLPILCDGLTISECFKGPNSAYNRLYTHLSGMAAARMRKIDRSRIMELLGNRKTSVPQDQIFGAMAAAGLSITPDYSMSTEEVWQLWCRNAIRHGHIRWALLPNCIGSVPTIAIVDCITPDFYTRHKSSPASELDSIRPLASVSEHEGSIIISGHRVGTCSILRRLGKVVEDQKGIIHRDVTLILFSDGSWSGARQIAQAFGGGRYNPRRIKAITAVLCLNYTEALRSICHSTLPNFRPEFQTRFQQHVWEDFMQLQMSMMSPIEDGVAYLLEIRNEWSVCLTATSLTHTMYEHAPMKALHFNAKTVHGRFILMIAQELSAESSFHKISTTIPVSLTTQPEETRSFNALLLPELPIEPFSIGGKRCGICHGESPPSPIAEGSEDRTRLKRLRALMKVEKSRKRLILHRKRPRFSIRMRRQ